MLTEKSLAERWWGHLPTLRTFLSGKPLVVENYPTSCHETLTEQIGRAVTYAMLVRQERAAIITSAGAREGLDQDLREVEKMLSWAARTLSDAQLDVQAVRLELC